MKKTDAITKEYLKDPVVFADACNFLFGENFVKADSLTEISETDVSSMIIDDDSIDAIQQFLDVMKKMSTIMDDGKAVYVLLGIENQTVIQYVLPLMAFLYDALRCNSQLEEIEKKNPKAKLHKGHSDDKIIPVITAVIYFGNKPWDGPRSLHDMMDIPKQFLPWVADYKINIIEPAALSDVDLKKFQSSLREVLTIVKYASDSVKLEHVLQENKNFEHLDSTAAKVIEAITGETIKGAERKSAIKTQQCKGLLNK